MPGEDLGPPGPGHTMEKLPDPKKHDPVKDPFPPLTPDIPEILEWKLDVLMFQLAKLRQALMWLLILGLLVIVPGLALALGLIIALLAWIAGVLGQIAALIAGLALLITLLAFMLGRRVVRDLEKLYL